MYRTSFNGLKVETYGVYTLYGLSAEEVSALKAKIPPACINGSSGDYTIFRDAKRYVYLKLFIHDHDLFAPIVIDIRPEILKITGKKKISQKLLKTIEINMPKTIYVQKVEGSWVLSNPQLISEVLATSGY